MSSERQAHRSLVDLLLSLFSAEELRQFVGVLPSGARLVHDLPGSPTSLSQLTFATVEVLERHGLINDDFFAALVRERPLRSADIEQVQAAWRKGASADFERMMALGSKPVGASPPQTVLMGELYGETGGNSASLPPTMPAESGVMTAIETHSQPAQLMRGLVVHSAPGADDYEQLFIALAPRERRGEIALRSIHEFMPAGEPAPAILTRGDLDRVIEAITEVDFLCFLLTPELLASPIAHPHSLAPVLAAAKSRALPVPVILVRPCLWRSTAFVEFPIVPSPDESVVESRGGWGLVAERIGLAIGRPAPESAPALADEPATVPYTHDTHAAVPFPPTGTPMRRSDSGGDQSELLAPERGYHGDDDSSGSQRVLRGVRTPPLELYEVFTTTGTPAHTFVDTEEIGRIKVKLRQPRKVLVVEGPSGIGKTVGLRRALAALRDADLGAWYARTRWLSSRTDADIDATEALLQQPVDELFGQIIIDDFHLLQESLKIRLGNMAKALADSDRKAKFVFVGINLTGQSLVAEIGDLATRCESVALQRQPDAVIVELILRGEYALNVRLRHRGGFALAAQGSMVVAQDLCYRALELQNILATCADLVRVDLAPESVIPDALYALRQQFHPGLQGFCMLDSAVASAWRGGPLALLYHLGRSEAASLMMNDVRPQYPQLKPSFAALADALAQTHANGAARWHSLLYCNPYSEQIALEDPKLQFYLHRLDWKPFARQCGVTMELAEDAAGVIFPKAVGSQPGDSLSDNTAIDTATATTDAADNPGDTGIVRILHISDLHFRAQTSWDSATVLGRLSADIARLVHAGQVPDVIVVTGDIAYSGAAAEYDLAERWFRERLLVDASPNRTPLDPRCLFIVPGNHDVNRKAVDDTVQMLQQGLMVNPSQKAVANLLEGSAADLVLARHQGFVHFLDRLGAAGQSWQRPWGILQRTIRGVSLHIAGFSSAWLSGSDDDRGNLVLGLWQCEQLFRDADRADLVIAAMHHPWDWFADWDADARNEVLRTAQVVLRGHLHQQEADARWSSDHGGTVEIAAGSAYDSSWLANGYHMLEFDPARGTVTIWPRYWDRQARQWRPDLNRFQGECGTMQFRR